MLKYTPKRLEADLEIYFGSMPIDEYTSTGMILALEVTKQTFGRYSKMPEFRRICRIARLKVEHSYEKGLRKNGGASNIFALKNMGWSDQQKVDITSKGEKLGFVALPDVNKSE